MHHHLWSPRHKWRGGMQAKEKKRKRTAWSTRMLEETAHRQECEDTEEIVLCRSISQDCVDGLWKELCGTLEEGVLEKYKVDEANKGACQGREEPLDWRIVKREKRFQPRMWREGCWAGIFSWFREYGLQRKKRFAGRKRRKKRKSSSNRGWQSWLHERKEKDQQQRSRRAPEACQTNFQC